MLPGLFRPIAVTHLNQHRKQIEDNHTRGLIFLGLRSALEATMEADENLMNMNSTTDVSLDGIDDIDDKNINGMSPAAPQPPPSPNTLRRSSIQIPRTRGLREFKASTAKSSQPAGVTKSHMHRRTQSLKLPLLINLSKAPFALPPFPPSIFPNPYEGMPSNPQAAAEKELQFLHRNIFIGTTSLDAFLRALDIQTPMLELPNTPRAPTATHSAITKAFATLADAEQLHARRHSQHASGWELVRRVDPGGNHSDYLSQAHVKLGAISLGEFMGYLGPQDGSDFGADSGETRVPVAVVIQAFEVASRRDVALGEGPEGAKVRAFRQWLVRERLGNGE